MKSLLRRSAFLAGGLFVFFLSSAQSRQGPLRPGDLLGAPNDYLNRSVEVEIVEPLSGPATPQALAAAEYGQVRVNIPDALGVEFALVPATFRPEDPNRYRQKFNRVIEAPVRVRGEFLSDEDLHKQTHQTSSDGGA